MSSLNDDDLQRVYTWVDEIQLSRPKRNIARDFSDGVLCAEIVNNFHPKIVDLHNFSQANSLSQKMYNWETLNKKVFKRLGFQMNKSDISDIVNCKSQAVERLLVRLQKTIAKYGARQRSGGGAQRSGRVGGRGGGHRGGGGGPGRAQGGQGGSNLGPGPSSGYIGNQHAGPSHHQHPQTRNYPGGGGGGGHDEGT